MTSLIVNELLRAAAYHNAVGVFLERRVCDKGDIPSKSFMTL